MNILLLGNYFGLDGTARAMQVYGKYLALNKHKVYACGLVKGGPRKKLIEKNVRKVFVARGSVKKIKEFIKSNKIDIVYWFSSPPATFNKEKILSLFRFCVNNNIKIWELSSFVWFDSDIDNMLHKRIFVSNACLQKFYYKFSDKIINKKKYTYLHLPIDTVDMQKYILSNEKISKLRNKFGIKKTDLVIGKVGRADIWKWSDEIIDIIPKLIKKNKNIKVVIRALPKEKLDKIKRKKLEEYFLLLPETICEKEICSTYQIIDIIVHTSRNGETFGTVLAEAMFFGKPIITTNTDFKQFTFFDRDNAQIELVKNRKNGFILNSKKEIVERIIYLGKNKKRYNFISRENKNRVKKCLSAEQIIENFEDMFYNKNSKVKYNKSLSIDSKDSLLNLASINIKALWEYMLYMRK